MQGPSKFSFRPWLAILAAAVVVGLFSFRSDIVADDLAEPPQSPGPNDARVTFIVTQLINEDHMSKHPLNDEISERALQQYLDRFDEMRRYFTQQDIDEFNAFRHEIDDLLKAKDVQLPYTIYRRFLQRLQERVKLVDELLEGKFDFDQDEEIVISAKAAKYAASEQETR
ncbi:MAG: hypothetical protein KDB14_06520, partial [Planctomycetales bacterium]|nr:hypothetical protein [Planctomycetales bacterium]